jgi:fumarate reductase flavoprotein subunit
MESEKYGNIDRFGRYGGAVWSIKGRFQNTPSSLMLMPDHIRLLQRNKGEDIMGTMDRRSFLKGSLITGALGAASLGLAGCTPSAANTETENVANDWLGSPPEITEADCSETIETEVLVIGAACAGTCAAFGAVDNGAEKVTIIEKHSTYHYGGNQLTFINSKHQLDGGVAWQDPQQLTYHIFRGSGNRADIALWWTWAQRGGGIADILIDKICAPQNMPVTFGGPTIAPELEMNGIWPYFVVFGDPNQDNLSPFISGVQSYLIEQGADIVFNTKAERLVTDDSGNVVGAIALRENGDHVFYRASNGVVVCTGSYGHNMDMVRAFYPPKIQETLGENACYMIRMKNDELSAEPLDTGEGHKMMVWAGADIESAIHGFCGWVETGILGGAYLQVNQNGRRFMNETIFPINDIQQLVEQYNPGGLYSWQIMSNEGIEMPNFVGVGQELVDFFADAAEHYEADTLEDLAKQIDVDPEVFLATIKRYNELCEQGEDLDFAKRMNYMIPVKTPPFKALKTLRVNACTLGGVKCTAKQEVMDVKGNAIPGLFAAGNTVGRRFGVSYESSNMGLSNSTAIVGGYIAGETCMKG